MSEARAKSKHRGKKNAVRAMPEEDPDFQIAPMIDVLLVLLVFFMSISSTEVLQSVKGIALPVAAEANEAGKNKRQMIVNVSWNEGLSNPGSITVDEKYYSSATELVPIIKERLKIQSDLRVVIRADKDARWTFMRQTLAAIGPSGVANVTFSVVDKEQPKLQAAAQ